MFYSYWTWLFHYNCWLAASASAATAVDTYRLLCLADSDRPPLRRRRPSAQEGGRGEGEETMDCCDSVVNERKIRTTDDVQTEGHRVSELAAWAEETVEARRPRWTFRGWSVFVWVSLPSLLLLLRKKSWRKRRRRRRRWTYWWLSCERKEKTNEQKDKQKDSEWVVSVRRRRRELWRAEEEEARQRQRPRWTFRGGGWSWCLSQSAVAAANTIVAGKWTIITCTSSVVAEAVFTPELIRPIGRQVDDDPSRLPANCCLHV